MVHVYVAGACEAVGPKPARGAWICPELQLYGVTKRVAAKSLNDGLRVGCAMAILSAVDALGERIIIHVPSTPRPLWLTNPKWGAPLPGFLYRILYKTEIHSRMEDGRLWVLEGLDEDAAFALNGILQRGEVPRLYSPCC